MGVVSNPNMKGDRPLHSSGSYFVYKMTFVMVYTGILSCLMDGWTYHVYKLLTGIVVQSACKWYIGRVWTLSRSEQLHWLYSCVTDFGGFGLTLIIYPTYYTGWRASFLTITGLLYALAVEYTEYTLFDKGTGTPRDHYLIKMKGNPWDAILFVILSLSFGVLGWYIDVYSATRWVMASWYTPLLWLLLFAVNDAVFGILHWATHVDPVLWEKHKVHHEYRGVDVNMFAGFYTEFSESVLAGFVVVMTLLMTMACGGATHHVMSDLGAAQLYSHHKYVSRHSHMAYNWEYDCLDLVFGRERISEFHWAHHAKGSRRFGVFGFIPDTWYPYGGTTVPTIIKFITRAQNKQNPNIQQTTQTQAHNKDRNTRTEIIQAQTQHIQFHG